VRLLIGTTPAVAVDMVLELSSAVPGEIGRMAEILSRRDSELLERRSRWPG
jgi:hypothetical protein